MRMARLSPGRTVQREFWWSVRAGCRVEEAAAKVGVSEEVGRRWFRDGGGMPNVSMVAPTGRNLSFQDREEIAVGIAAGESDAQIGRRIGRSMSTISREITRNAPRYADGFVR